MTDHNLISFLHDCEGLAPEQIIAAHYADYFNAELPHVRAAFGALGIEGHEVTAWVMRHIK